MKVLIVDDSVVFRSAIKTALIDSDYVTDVDIAANGKIAIDKLKMGKYDGITLDIEMPVMDGIETVKEIRKFDTTIPIIIFSAQNAKAAGKTITALQAGANDFVEKRKGSNDLNENLNMIQAELVPRFKALLKSSHANVAVKPTPSPSARGNKLKSAQYSASLICLASSTGGPDVLMKVFKGLDKLNVPVLMVQHMPPVFTTQLANALNSLGPNTVKEAQDGEILEAGTCYLAPGDFHMEINPLENKKYKISLNQNDKVCFVRPSADVLFQSVAKNYHGNVASFIFTGMGNDGEEGSKFLKEKNGLLVIQDETSSVVWGMPGAVYENDLQDEIQTPEEIIKTINSVVL